MIRSARLPLRLPLAGLVALALPLPIAGNASALIMFSSPSRNIGCAMDRGFARCDVAKKRWHAPPKPKRCMLDWGNGLLVGRRGRAQFVCAGDTTLDPRNRILPYGRSRSVGAFTCTSRKTGMTCSHSGSGHGFTVSRTRWKVF